MLYGNNYDVLLIGPTTDPTSQTSSSSPTTAGTNVGANSSSRSSSSDAAIIGTVIGVCVLVLLVFCTVVILLVVLFLNNRRIQAQQQWQKDPEFQVNKIHCWWIITSLPLCSFYSIVATIFECWIDESATHSFQ